MKSITKIFQTPTAFVVLLAAICSLIGIIIQVKSDENIAKLPIHATQTAEAKLTTVALSTSSIDMESTRTVNLADESAGSLPSVYIADWSGATLYPGDTLILSTESCFDDSEISVYTGEKPAYWIIYETWISLTFVNSTDLPNGIISIEPIYKNSFEQAWRLSNWYITIYKTRDTSTPISLPIELPPKTPIKLYFRAIHLAQTYPEQGVVPVLEYGNTLSPFTWTFNIVNDEQVIQTFDLYISGGEATNDGKYEFTHKCEEILPEWQRIPLPGRDIPSPLETPPTNSPSSATPPPSPLPTATPDCSLTTELGPWPSGSIVHLDARNGWIQADFWSSDRLLIEGYDEVSVLLEPGLEVEFVGVGGNGWEYGREWNRQDVDWCIEKHIRDSWNIRHKKLIYITLAELCATIECR